MTMQRRHFEMIASVLRGCEPYCRTEAEAAMFKCIVAQFANKLETTNPNFNRDKFVAACGVFEEVVRKLSA